MDGVVARGATEDLPNTEKHGIADDVQTNAQMNQKSTQGSNERSKLIEKEGVEVGKVCPILKFYSLM